MKRQVISRETRFSTPTGGVVGEVVRFVEEDGQVVRMVTGDSYIDRVRDQTSGFDPTEAEPVSDFLFDQSLHEEFED